MGHGRFRGGFLCGQDVRVGDFETRTADRCIGGLHLSQPALHFLRQGFVGGAHVPDRCTATAVGQFNGMRQVNLGALLVGVIRMPGAFAPTSPADRHSLLGDSKAHDQWLTFHIHPILVLHKFAELFRGLAVLSRRQVLVANDDGDVLDRGVVNLLPDGRV